MVVILMGVSGCGKTTVGRLLAHRMGLPFYDGDDFHPIANIEKMRNGRPLDDNDRLPWLFALAGKIAEWERQGGAILACSALKESYRNILAAPAARAVRFVHLRGSMETIARRLQRRQGHYMPHALLESQFAALEPPNRAIAVSVEAAPEAIVDTIVQQLNTPGGSA